MSSEARYLRLRADTLMGMFRRLAPEERARALAALARATAEAGGDSARRYLARVAGDKPGLLDLVVKSAAELGWGIWRFERSAATRLALEVADSPFAAGYGAAEAPVCAPIAGMLAAVASLVLEAECEAREIECRACGPGACRFEAIARQKP
ncbi:MAG: 4-vinyl reductase [Pseudomonadota bacterium]